MVGSVSSVLELGVGGFATEDSIGVLERDGVEVTDGAAVDVLVAVAAVAGIGADDGDEGGVVDERGAVDKLAEGAVDCPHPAATATAPMHRARAIRCRREERGCLVTAIRRSEGRCGSPPAGCRRVGRREAGRMS
jgi:hypothetical protein